MSETNNALGFAIAPTSQFWDTLNCRYIRPDTSRREGLPCQPERFGEGRLLGATTKYIDLPWGTNE